MASGLEETERLSDLAENLLTLARSDAGAMHPRLVDTDLREQARAVIDRIGSKAESKDIRVTLDAPREVWAVCDPGLIDRLVWNLLDNAINFTTPGGRVEVTLAVRDGEVMIDVADTGPGIRQEPIERVFERFNRGDAAHGGPDGAGLGLSMVQAIAEAHGGQVSVKNRVSGGARFTVSLPRDVIEP
jgi:signal transduction histidine kinase